VRTGAVALLATAAAIIAACTGPPADAKPSAQPEPTPAEIAYTIWRYDRTLLPPRDTSTYENVLLDAKPLSDGGWIVLRAVDPRRYLTDPTVYGPLVKQPYGELLKLDAAGRIVAKEHAAEPLGPTKVDVFEEQGVVVAQGRQVRNGTVHALRLDTLDGIASELTNCIAIDGRCWSYRTFRSQGPTALEERDPRTLAVVRTYPQLTMDGLQGQPAIFPSLNLIAWQRATSSAPSPRRGVRAEALDPARPIAVPWIDRLRDACDVVRVGDDRAWIQYGPPGCEGDSGWRSDVVEVSSGRIVHHLATDDYVSGNELAAGRLVTSPFAIDPRSGAFGPLVPDRAVTLDFDRGLALVPLTGGGSAVLRRRDAVARPTPLSHAPVASGRCRDVDFPRVVLGPADFVCSGMSVHLDPGHLLVATGRNYRAPVDFDVTRATIDPATRQMEIAYSVTSAAPRPQDSGPVRVISLTDVPAGEWLVRLTGSSGPASAAFSGTDSTFVVRFP
jgi:hypothetical protein